MPFDNALAQRGSATSGPRKLRSQVPAPLIAAPISRGVAVRAYLEHMAYERITIHPGRMCGIPRIRDTRVTVSAVLGQLAAGRTTDQILADYPYLERDDVLAALEFAADAVAGRELPLAQSA